MTGVSLVQVICLCNVVMLMSYSEALLLIRRWRKTVFITTQPLERVRSSTILVKYCGRVFLLYWVGYGKLCNLSRHPERCCGVASWLEAVVSAGQAKPHIAIDKLCVRPWFVRRCAGHYISV
jgi:hypothetical protein